MNAKSLFPILFALLLPFGWGCPAMNGGPPDEAPVETVEGLPEEPAESIPPMTIEELERFRQEITEQYREIDARYEELDDAYDEAFERGAVEMPSEIRALHEGLEERHREIAQLHEDRILLMLDIPEIIENDLELGEINRRLAISHDELAQERFLDDMPANVFRLRQDLLLVRRQMMELHDPRDEGFDDFEELDEFDEQDSPSPAQPDAPRQPSAN